VVDRKEAQTAFARLLIERVRQDKHPSSTHMQLIEETLPPELTREYLNVLLEKALSDKHPSIPMLQRIKRVTEAL
jgi:hypothetical protein